MVSELGGRLHEGAVVGAAARLLAAVLEQHGHELTWLGLGVRGRGRDGERNRVRVRVKG